MPVEVAKVEYVEMTRAEFVSLTAGLVRGQVGYAGGMPPPELMTVRTGSGRDRSGVKRVPCGGGFRIIRKRLGSN